MLMLDTKSRHQCLKLVTHIMQSLQNIIIRNATRFVLKTNSSTLASEDHETKEFEMSNVQQMNLIGFYYHGYVSLHIISRQSFQINLIKTIIYGPYDYWPLYRVFTLGKDRVNLQEIVRNVGDFLENYVPKQKHLF